MVNADRCNEVRELVLGQFVEVDDRLVEQPPGHPVPDGAGAEIFGDRLGLRDELAQPGVEVARGYRRRAARRADQHRQHAPLDVIEDVAGLAHECVLVAGHTRQHTEIEQESHDRNEVAALLAPAELEGDARGGEPLVAGGDDDPFGESAERDLCVGALQDAQRQAHKHVATAAEGEMRTRVASGMSAPRVRLGELE